MSFDPKLPSRRFEKKNSQWPSPDSAGPASLDPVLTGGPRLTGSSQAQAGSSASVQARCDTQMLLSSTASFGPSGRLDAKNSVSPSLESVDCASLNGELIVGPRFTGSDHDEKLDVWLATRVPAMLRSDSVLHPGSKARSVSEARMQDAFLMWTSWNNSVRPRRAGVTKSGRSSPRPSRRRRGTATRSKIPCCWRRG